MQHVDAHVCAVRTSPAVSYVCNRALLATQLNSLSHVYDQLKSLNHVIHQCSPTAVNIHIQMPLCKNCQQYGGQY